MALRRLDVRHDRGEHAAWQSAFPIGEILRFPPGSPYTRCIETGLPVLEQAFTADSARKLAKSWRRKPVGGLFSDMSMLVIPAVSKGTVLGLFCCFREAGTRKFDRYDMEMGMEFAARSAVFFNHATRYNREHATALTLQRAMLPTGLTYPSSVEVKHRYLPGSELVEVGGDWYESIRLPGARVALVVGDVAGHGVRAAVTMGRLRTAIQTLAMLELPPAESLQQLDELMQTIGEREPHFATCAYAVYDAVTGEIELAVAGHLPPLLVHPDGRNEYLEVTPSPPLGIGNGVVETKRSSPSRTARSSCCTPTAWSSRGTGTSPRASTGCRPRSARARQSRTSRTCARPPWTACTPTPSATTSRCSSPSCGAFRKTTGSASRWSPSSPRCGMARSHDPRPAQALGSRGPDPRHASCWSPSWSPTRSSTPRARSCCG